VDLRLFQEYISRLQQVLEQQHLEGIYYLAESLQEIWKQGKKLFICGNGGSAANAIHLANDFLYGISKSDGIGLRVLALPSNQAVITCLGNDISYEDIFSHQLAVQGNPGDILLGLSGSGNSPNIVKAIEQSKRMDIKSFAILGYSGGKCLDLVDTPIHFPVDDMQISEDLQQIVGHMVMQWLRENAVI
jgi:D-sedoheptulose 7-phosphate isomerase